MGSHGFPGEPRDHKGLEGTLGDRRGIRGPQRNQWDYRDPMELHGLNTNTVICLLNNTLPNYSSERCWVQDVSERARCNERFHGRISYAGTKAEQREGRGANYGEVRAG